MSYILSTVYTDTEQRLSKEVETDTPVKARVIFDGVVSRFVEQGFALLFVRFSDENDGYATFNYADIWISLIMRRKDIES
jgi:hypothetical protein